LPTLTVTTALVEALGSQSIVYFQCDARALRPGAEDVEDPADLEGGEGVTATRPNLIAEFPAQTSVRLDEEIPLAVDTAKLHFFDEETGEPLH
jgi:multiple sugar transport system ATP-binding protein